MSLPEVKSPTFRKHLVGINKTVEFRPFLVKDQKNLLLSKMDDDVNSMIAGIYKVVEECTFGKVDPYKLPYFDLEFLFLQMRSKSSGEELELKYRYKTVDDDGNEKFIPISTSINLDDVKITLPKKINNEIEVGNGIYIKLKYPSLDIMTNIQSSDNVSVMRGCIDYVYDKEQTYDLEDETTEAVEEFIGNFGSGTLEKIKKFFEEMPRLEHTFDIKLPDGKTKSVTLRGLQDFFE